MRSRSLRLVGMITILIGGPCWGRSYGEALLAAARARYPHVQAIRIDTKNEMGQPLTLSFGEAGAQNITVPLYDGLGGPIGTMSVSGPRPSVARSIAGYVSRRAYTARVLFEAVPFVQGAATSRLGQRLVERAVDRDPELVTIALHANLPDGSNRIVASNFGRIGKIADDDDRHVISTGIMLQEVTNAGRRLAVELPLLDRRRHIIGALSTSFLLSPNLNQEKAAVRARALCDALAQSIDTIDAITKI